MSGRKLAAVLVIFAAGQTQVTDACAFGITLKRLADGTNDICEKLIGNRVSTFDPDVGEICAKVPDSDVECKAKCTQLEASKQRKLAQLKDEAAEDARKGGERFARGYSKSNKDEFCKLKTGWHLSDEQCQASFSEGEKLVTEEVERYNESERQRIQQRLAESESEKLKAYNLQKFYDSDNFQRLKQSVAAIAANARIDVSLQEQSRQREIANQSGYINKSAMHALGAQIVDSRAKLSESLKIYAKHGGKAKDASSISKLIKQCNIQEDILVRMYILAETGHMTPPDSNEQTLWSLAGACL